MNYYKSLDKNKKEKIRKEFLESNDKSLVYRKANKIVIISLLGIFISFIAGIFDYLYKTGLVNYVLDGLLLVFSIIFFIKMQNVKSHELNTFALSKKDHK